MAFRGWPAEAIEFYEGLEADNSKTYWLAHKGVERFRTRYRITSDPDPFTVRARSFWDAAKHR